MALSSDAIDVMLDELGTVAVYAGLLDETDTEISGGDPAYARKAVTWAAASGGSIAANGTLPSFDVPAGTVSKVILCSALTGGTTYATIDVENEVFAAQGNYTLTSLTISGS